MQPALYRFHSEIQRGSRFLYIKPLYHAQDENRSVMIRQRRDRSLQDQSQFVIVRLFFGISCL